MGTKNVDGMDKGSLKRKTMMRGVLILMESPLISLIFLLIIVKMLFMMILHVFLLFYH